MSMISAIQVGRGLYKWRKAIAAAVIIESVLSHKMKSKSKKHSKKNDLMSSTSDFLSDLRARADDYIEEARKNMKK